MNKTKIIISYCLPALIALSLILSGYYVRTQNVSATIMLYKQKVDENYKNGNGELGKREEKEGLENIVRLIAYLKNNKLESEKAGKNEITRESVRSELYKVWERNSIFISVMVLLPYILFASRLAFSERITISEKERLESTASNWWMKFMMACVMTIGWIYVLNPTGRGESTLAQYLINVDLAQKDSLPIYIKYEGIVPVVAGFLGWYLYLLTYFFSKLVHHDVVSARVYSLMFKKFLFTYGIALVLPSIQVASSVSSMVQIGQGQSIFMFFLGYFPLAAFSMLKEAGLKLGGNFKSDSGYLTELPGISRWQVMRLEEEGIENMAALAYSTQQRLRDGLLSMATVIDLWIDVAQLYVVLGHDDYQKVKHRCKTASGFIAKSNDPEFLNYIATEEIGDGKEIARLLERTFKGKLITLND